MCLPQPAHCRLDVICQKGKYSTSCQHRSIQAGTLTLPPFMQFFTRRADMGRASSQEHEAPNGQVCCGLSTYEGGSCPACHNCSPCKQLGQANNALLCIVSQLFVTTCGGSAPGERGQALASLQVEAQERLFRTNQAYLRQQGSQPGSQSPLHQVRAQIFPGFTYVASVSDNHLRHLLTSESLLDSWFGESFMSRAC